MGMCITSKGDPAYEVYNGDCSLMTPMDLVFSEQIHLKGTPNVAMTRMVCKA